MASTPTYQELESQIAKLQKKIKIHQLDVLPKDEQIYHSLFENMTEGFARCKMLYKNDEPIDFIYLEVNKAFEKLTGLKQVVGKPISEILPNHKNENPSLFNMYERVTQTGISEKIETFVTDLGIWFSISVYSSEKNEFLVIFDNITERKKSQESLLFNEAKFRGLFTQSHVGTAIVGLDKCFVKINKAFCDFLGYPEKEILGKTIADFTFPEDIALGMKDVKRIVKGEIEFSTVQKRYLRKDGSIVWGELTISIVRDDKNKPLYFLPIIQDITVSYKAAKALKESEARFQQLIKNSFDMIVLIDSNGIQNFVSKSCEKILGYQQKELIGIPIIKQMIHPEDQKSTIKSFFDIVKNNSHGGIQYRHNHKNGGWVYLEAYGNNQLDNPDINSIVLNIRDITERKQAEQIIKENEEKLRNLNATKDKLFSIIAHDLRSPFNSILGFSELLIKNSQNFEVAKAEKYLEIINSSAKNTLSLLNNLLDWAKTQTGQIIYKPEKINLATIISDVIELSHSNAKAKNITLNHIQPDIIEIYTDMNILKVVLRNLISNALKFTNSNGKIEISAIKNQNNIEITVSDNGIGMNKETQHKLFKIDPTIVTDGTNAEKGSGLGLILCKEFVEKLNGKIWIESEENIGSKFIFTVPLKKMQ